MCAVVRLTWLPPSPASTLWLVRHEVRLSFELTESWMAVDASGDQRRLQGLHDLGITLVAYKRRIGPWLLWRAGPARGADARYLAVDSRDLSRQHTFRLAPDGTGEGVGPDGVTHPRFRAWKESLRDD